MSAPASNTSDPKLPPHDPAVPNSIPKASAQTQPTPFKPQEPTTSSTNNNAEAIQSALAKLGGLTRRTSLTGSRGGGFTPLSNSSKGNSKPGSGSTSLTGSQANSTVTSPNLLPTSRGAVNELSLSPPGMRGSLEKVMEGSSDAEASCEVGAGTTYGLPSPGISGPGATSSVPPTLSRISSHSSNSNISAGPIDAPSDILERSRPTTPGTISQPLVTHTPLISASGSGSGSGWAGINVIGATPQGTPVGEFQRKMMVPSGESNEEAGDDEGRDSSAGSATVGGTPRARTASLLQRTPSTSFHAQALSATTPGRNDINTPSTDSTPPDQLHPTPRTLANLLSRPNNLQGSRTTTSGTPTSGAHGPLGTSTAEQSTNPTSLLSREVTNAFTTNKGNEKELGAGASASRNLSKEEGRLQAQEAERLEGFAMDEARARSAPSTPHFGAQTDMLKTLDESTRVIRQSQNRDSTRAPSVSGIGNLVEKPDYSEAKIVVAMVGLPARGKSYLSNKLMRYLRWLEYKVEVFNVGQLRRSKARDQIEAGKGQVDHSANYFSSSNAQANESREQLANESLESLISWLKTEGNVGIHDATNSTSSRRSKIQARVAQEPGLQLIFLESLCDDPATIATNIALKVSSGDPDYKGMSKADAERDFRKRIEQYEKVYETIAEPSLSYCKILNVGRQVTINRVTSYLQSRIAFYLMNLHLKPRSVYLSRHGESMHNVGGMIGGDSPLSPRGERYASALPALVLDNIGDAPLTVWTSTLQRTVSTSRFLPYPKKTWKSLDELDAGVCDGMTYEEIADRYPEDYESRDEDKFNYRYRGGESYRDVVVRLEPVIMELERQENILIICHQAVIRCLYAYFMALPQEELPYIKVPLHTLIKLTPMAYGCHEERYPLPIAAVDTHRPKPVRKSAIGSPVDPNAVEESHMGPNLASTARDYFGSGLVQKLAHESIKEEAVQEEEEEEARVAPDAILKEEGTFGSAMKDVKAATP